MKIRPAIPVTSQSPYNEFHVHQFLGLALSHPRTHENRTLDRCRWVRFGRWSWNKPILLTPLYDIDPLAWYPRFRGTARESDSANARTTDN
ncbi:hypothetical protein QLX08_011600 [Tetragonisca angustula]|uniref:Uncharacterized protein n=1 Tax=Tetragonisca angustula TaxID=166442 RepID=A0AAW0Z7V8_9HYME